KKWIDIYHEVCRLEKIPPQEMIMGDSRRVIPERFKDSETIDFILTDVPFWKMDIVKKSKGVFKKVGEPSKGVYSDKSKLSKFNEDPKMQIRSMEEWMDLLKVVFTHCYEILKPGKYCAVFIGNMYHGGRYYLLNADLASILEKIGFVLKGEYVWYDVAKKLHLYGINYAWIPSLTHQFIMIFRKERNGPLTEEEKKKLIARNLKIAKSNKKKSSGMSRLKI
ncbi:MAG: DNA methyltransferase, partial [Promethearchaeota archaeon]